MKAKNECRLYFGKKFYKQTSGYWVLREWDKVYKVYHTYLAHRWVWENINGPILTDMDIHHIDGDKDNNDIHNLQEVSRSAHLKIHSKEDSRKKQLDSVRPIEWLKSEEGRAAVSETGKISWENREETLIICESCGQSASFKRWAKFCSKNCYMRWCHKNQINFIAFTCETCGKVGKKPRSKKTRFCSISCAKRGRISKS